MLKAYDFSRYKDLGRIGTNSFNKLENEIAEALVKSISIEEVQDTGCTVCDSSDTEKFFEKWGVIYYRCNECKSIFVKTSKEKLQLYKENKDLKQLRISREYQQEENEIRDLNWEELLDWVKFRTFRYSGKKNELKIIDYGNRYRELAERIRKSNLCGQYELRESIIEHVKCDKVTKADIVLYFNKIQQSLDPLSDLKEVYNSLDEDGLLFLSTRIGTGFDVLTLKGEAKIFPYEHILLPSVNGMEMLLKKAGFTMLEYSTPGRRDIEYVYEHRSAIDTKNLFLKYMIDNGDEQTFSEFQRFLQKNGLSSHAQIVVKKGKRV